jgi:tetratricopeptide (TPR) repeat protein
VKLKKHFINAAIAAAVVCSADVAPADTMALAAAATESYSQGNFSQAAASWEQAAEEAGTNGHLFYNLGLSYYKNGEKGRAMAAFLAARQRLPRDPDVKLAIAQIEKSLAVQVSAEDHASWRGAILPFLAWASNFEWRAAGSAILTCSFLMLLLGLLFRGRHRTLQLAGRTGVLCAVVVLALAYAKSSLEPMWGAVTAAETDVLSGPNPKTNSVIFRLEEGSPVKVHESVNGWTKIELADGKRGWLASANMKSY